MLEQWHPKPYYLKGDEMIVPLGNRVLVKQAKTEDVSPGGIMLPGEWVQIPSVTPIMEE